jgi:hypothetical protein
LVPDGERRKHDTAHRKHRERPDVRLSARDPRQCLPAEPLSDECREHITLSDRKEAHCRNVLRDEAEQPEKNETQHRDR